MKTIPAGVSSLWPWLGNATFLTPAAERPGERQRELLGTRPQPSKLGRIPSSHIGKVPLAESIAGSAHPGIL